MKKLKWNEYMTRPFIYRTVTKAAAILALSLIWSRWASAHGTQAYLLDGCLSIGGIVLLFSWFQYLKLDGISLRHLRSEKKEKKKKPLFTRDIADFADEKIIPYEALEDDERTKVSFLSNVCAGALHVGIGLIGMLIR